MAFPIARKLGTFPVTQQAIGLVAGCAGLIEAVVNLAKLAFHKIKKLYEGYKYNSLSTSMISMNLPKIAEHHQKLISSIEKDKNLIREGFEMMCFGIITMTPIVGTIFNGRAWYRYNNPTPPAYHF